jgi:hypothetical protein
MLKLFYIIVQKGHVWHELKKNINNSIISGDLASLNLLTNYPMKFFWVFKILFDIVADIKNQFTRSIDKYMLIYIVNR